MVGGFPWQFQLHRSCAKGNLSLSHQTGRKLWVLKLLFSERERKKLSLKAKLLLSKNKVKYISDFQEAHFSVHQNNAAHDLLLFLISVYIYKYIYSCFHLGDPDPYQVLSHWHGESAGELFVEVSPSLFFPIISSTTLSFRTGLSLFPFLTVAEMSWYDANRGRLSRLLSALTPFFLKCSSCISIIKSLKWVLAVETNNDRDYKVSVWCHFARCLSFHFLRNFTSKLLKNFEILIVLGYVYCEFLLLLSSVLRLVNPGLEAVTIGLNIIPVENLLCLRQLGMCSNLNELLNWFSFS